MLSLEMCRGCLVLLVVPKRNLDLLHLARLRLDVAGLRGLRDRVLLGQLVVGFLRGALVRLRLRQQRREIGLSDLFVFIERLSFFALFRQPLLALGSLQLHPGRYQIVRQTVSRELLLPLWTDQIFRY